MNTGLAFKTIVLCALVSLSSCGGGGGGGGSSSSGVRILHAALDGTPIELTSTGRPGEIAQTNSFGKIVGFSSLPGGAQDLQLYQRGDAGPLATVSVEVEKGDRRSILIYEADSSTARRTSLINDIPPELESGMAAVKLVHGVRLSGALTLVVNGTVTALPVSVGQASDYVIVPAGTVTLQAKTGSGRSLASVSQQATSGNSYTTLFAGEAGYLVLARTFAD